MSEKKLKRKLIELLAGEGGEQPVSLGRLQRSFPQVDLSELDDVLNELAEDGVVAFASCYRSYGSPSLLGVRLLSA
jgi:hypothetical protein